MWVLSGELSAPWRRLVGLPYRPPIKMHTHILYKIKHILYEESMQQACDNMHKPTGPMRIHTEEQT